MCENVRVVELADGRFHCRQEIVGAVATGRGYDEPVVVGCNARFSEREARLGYLRMLQRRKEEQRRFQEHRETERRERDALEALRGATLASEIAPLLREVLDSRYLGYWEVDQAFKAAWRKLLSTGVIRVADAEIVRLRLCQRLLTPTIQEQGRRRVWSYDVAQPSATWWLDDTGETWKETDLSRSWDAPWRGADLVFRVGVGTVVKAAAVKWAGRSPSRWDWDVPNAQPVSSETNLGRAGLIVVGLLADVEVTTGVNSDLPVPASTEVVCPECGESVAKARRCRRCAGLLED
jgi:predicted RNA-binding Zn-ribbon protein involved in translation (DUF1610 family)